VPKSTDTDQVVHFEVEFPPTEEGLYVPTQLINLSHFFSRQVVSVGGYPVILACNTISNKAQFFHRLALSFVAEKNYVDIEDNTAGSDGILTDGGFEGILFDAAYKKNFSCPPLVKESSCKETKRRQTELY
jgi:hypothetical protein